MKESILVFIKTHMMGTLIGIATAAAVGGIVTIAIVSSDEQGEMAILEAGIADIPAIKNDDLQELGNLYSELNDEFEREIDALVSGKANRNNKANKPINHYGVYGKENVDPFKNDEYINGISITYEKATKDIADGKNNFNDILAVMAILYDQKMDKINISELKQVFTDMFWLSHTYTFDTTELYPCKKGCVATDKYKCTDVYDDYKNNAVLKYDPFTVRKHDEYESLPSGKSYLMDEDFRYVYPAGQCEVCGKTGAGCIWQENKTCFHGSGGTSTLDKYSAEANTIGEVVYGDLGDDYKPEEADDTYLGDGTLGQKLERTDTKCKYYKIVKYCKIREKYANDIKIAKEELESAEDAASKHSDNCNYKGDDECPTCKSNDEKVEKLSEELSALQSELETHISTVCEVDQASAKYWCDGYKLCLGHKTHYKCPGHKLVVCYGHTNINVTIKILYRNELLDAAYNSFR